MDVKTVSLLITSLTPVVVPLVIIGVKKISGDKHKWILPALASILGGVIDAINLFITGNSVGPAWGIVLGAAGVALREFVDQVKKSV